MLSFRPARLRHRSLVSVTRPFLPSSPHHIPASRRRLFQGLCDGFLDLAVALPIPPSLPPYSTTIIIVTVVTRFALLPISIWGKQYTRRIEDMVMPEMEKLKPVAAKRVLEEMKKQGVRGDKQYLQDVHKKMTIELLQARQKQIFQEHKFKPWLPIILPPLSQLPFFFGFSVMLSRLSSGDTPFDSEAFLTLSTLAHPDPTMTLPIILGFITMANVESSQWVMNAAERAELRRVEDHKADQIRQGAKPKLELAKVLKTSLRGLSIVRIIIAAIAPGSVTLYWVTSAAFGLVQTWITDYIAIRRKRKLQPPVIPASVTSGPLPVQARVRK
ncbi:60Kd inner membrane protein-domain-containing protein [Cyathus striatus]|nr:60Kd inner membrane protein-domain-containing protein [Cyathus striatus]